MAERDPQSGHLRKRAYGPWIIPVFRYLAKLRFLRGTPFDIFGHSEERRTERRLIGEYEAVLAEIISCLSDANYETAIELAALPLEIRGFGHVKRANLIHVKEKEASLLRQLHSGVAAHALAAE